MIRLEHEEKEVSIDVAIPREAAVSIVQALAFGWRFVEEVQIGAPPVAQAKSAKVAKPSPAKAERKPRAKAPAKTKAAAKPQPQRNLLAESAVRDRLAFGDMEAKPIMRLAGMVLGGQFDIAEIRAALDYMRNAGEVEVIGQKRGAKYRLVQQAGAATAVSSAAE